MKLEGSHIVAAPRQVVWDRLMNPEALARSMPGCEKMERNADGSFQAELKLGIAAVKGTYRARIEVLDPVQPERYRMKVEGQGTGGFVRGEGTITLAENGSGTIVSFSGDAQVGGLIASVGQRLIQGAAKQVVNQFFESFARQTGQPS